MSDTLDHERDTIDLIRRYATGLIQLQHQLDTGQTPNACFQGSLLQRCFDTASCLNMFCTNGQRWPEDIGKLVNQAAKPLRTWIRHWPSQLDEQLGYEALIEDDFPSPACHELASSSNNPDSELTEARGYQHLLQICASHPNGQQIYVLWRRYTIQYPVIENRAYLLREAERQCHDELVQVLTEHPGLIEDFYQGIAPSMVTEHGDLPLCTLSDTLLSRREDTGSTTPPLSTDYRNPEARRKAAARIYRSMPYQPGVMQLKHAFRRYWCLPGKTELALEQALRARGWTTELWPRLDRVDLTAVSPFQRRLALDVKDYQLPTRLARHFRGFKEYGKDHECWLVIPDYLLELNPQYITQFEQARTSLGRNPVRLLTFSQLLAKLDQS